VEGSLQSQTQAPLFGTLRISLNRIRSGGGPAALILQFSIMNMKLDRLPGGWYRKEHLSCRFFKSKVLPLTRCSMRYPSLIEKI